MIYAGFAWADYYPDPGHGDLTCVLEADSDADAITRWRELRASTRAGYQQEGGEELCRLEPKNGTAGDWHVIAAETIPAT